MKHYQGNCEACGKIISGYDGKATTEVVSDGAYIKCECGHTTKIKTYSIVVKGVMRPSYWGA